MLIYPDIDPVIVTLGPFQMRWYSLAYIFGIISPLYFFKQTFSKKLAMSVDDCLNYISYLIFSVIIGGRIGYVLFYDLSFYLENPFSIIKIWQGGMSYHGGALGTIIGTLIYATYYKKSKLILLDILSIGSTIGIGLGRVANFINGELYGRVTTSSFGMVFPAGGPLPRHPSQLYEAFFEGVILFLILWTIRKLKAPKPGYIGALYLIGYSSFRFFIEFFREPDSHIGIAVSIFSRGQLYCIAQLIIGCIVILYLNRYYKNQNQNL
mgnify:CR=1 FL=1|jgi:phosphatidylglycerol---prolipoprotein diacylglyceryl transferase